MRNEPQFAPEHNLLLVSSWNAEVRMYDVLVNARRATYTHKAAVLDTCWGIIPRACMCLFVCEQG
jgi:hypothetical protein